MSSRTWLVGLVVVAAAAGGLALRQSYAESSGGSMQARDVPPQVVVNAQIARQRMQRIVQAVLVYQNDHDNQLPPTLSALYPEFISDPLVFWHPGDGNPAPTTIDNDVPNAPNSALISFDIELVDPWQWPGDRSYIRDNSPTNNGGLFVNELWDCWETDPPGLMPTPTATAVARQRLRGLAASLASYSNDNYDWWPDDVLHLAPHIGPPQCSRRAFWHPGDDQPMPAAITNSVLNGLDSAQISFEYLVAGLNENYWDPNLACFRDNSPDNNGGYGILVSYIGLRVDFIPVCPGDATGDRQVGGDDFVRVAENVGRFETANPWDGDLNADSNTDLLDLAILQLHFGDVCPTTE